MHIEQAYLVSGEPEVRVRRKGDRFLITLKRGTGLSRSESEAEIDTLLGEDLLAAFPENNISKRRYRIDRWEVDVFREKLEGLVMAEIELARADEPLPAVPPELELTREVTGETRYANASLAGLSSMEAQALI